MTTRHSRKRPSPRDVGGPKIDSSIPTGAAHSKEPVQDRRRTETVDSSSRVSSTKGPQRAEGHGNAVARNLEGFTHYRMGGLGIPLPVIDGWFSRLEEEAIASGDPIPSPEVIAEAKRIVTAFRYLFPHDTDVYTPGDGKVEVEVSGATGYGLSLICEPGGSALCLIAAKNASRRSRYNDSSELPDGFLQKGLTDVRRSRRQDFFQG